MRPVNESRDVALRCIGSTTEDDNRRVIASMLASDEVRPPSTGTMTTSNRPILA